jgi:hypothetical protein
VVDNVMILLDYELIRAMWNELWTQDLFNRLKERDWEDLIMSPKLSKLGKVKEPTMVSSVSSSNSSNGSNNATAVVSLQSSRGSSKTATTAPTASSKKLICINQLVYDMDGGKGGMTQCKFGNTCGFDHDWKGAGKKDCLVAVKSCNFSWIKKSDNRKKIIDKIQAHQF